MDEKNKPVVTIKGIAAGGEGMGFYRLGSMGRYSLGSLGRYSLGGLGRVDGKTVFVRLSAPGDTVRCRIVEEHKTWARAELLEVLEPSPARVTPQCPHYGVCGGCDLQHMSYEAQLAAKTTILKDAFTRIGGLAPPDPEIYPSAPWEYRNRMQLHCIKPLYELPHTKAPRHEEMSVITNPSTSLCAFVPPCEFRRKFSTRLLGLKARKSAKIIPVDDCPVADPGIRALLREATGGQVLLSGIRKERFTAYSHGGLFLCEGGIEQGKTRLLDREIHLDASVFFQSNAAMLETLIAGLRDIARDADHSRRMADLYCGIGTFAAFLGEDFPCIDLMEENARALELARKNICAGVS